MGKSRTIVTCIVTALIIPAVIIIAWYLDPELLDMYHKFDISGTSFGAWRIGLAAFCAIAALWIGSRALKHTGADTISIAIGLIICLGFVFIVGIKSLVGDIGLLIVVLMCGYVGALIITTVSKKGE